MREIDLQKRVISDEITHDLIKSYKNDPSVSLILDSHEALRILVYKRERQMELMGETASRDMKRLSDRIAQLQIENIEIRARLAKHHDENMSMHNKILSHENDKLRSENDELIKKLKGK